MTFLSAKTGTCLADRLVPVAAVFVQGGRVDDDHRKEVSRMVNDIVLFILSALALVAAGKQFLQRGENLGLWGAWRLRQAH